MRDYDDIPDTVNLVVLLAETFAEPSLDAIADDSTPHLFANCQSNAGLI